MACWSPDFNVTYTDGPSLCDAVNTWNMYYQNAECAGNTYWPKTLTVDQALMAQAQTEAQAVAGGATPKGPLTCANSGCTTDPIQSQDEWFYIDGIGAGGNQASGFNSDHLMFTAPESSLVIAASDGFSYKDGGGAIPLLDCHFINQDTASRIWIYHYCPTAGPKPSRMGCGSAVDSKGNAWRVLLEAP